MTRHNRLRRSVPPRRGKSEGHASHSSEVRSRVVGTAKTGPPTQASSTTTVGIACGNRIRIQTHMFSERSKCFVFFLRNKLHTMCGVCWDIHLLRVFVGGEHNFFVFLTTTCFGRVRCKPAVLPGCFRRHPKFFQCNCGRVGDLDGSGWGGTMDKVVASTNSS